MISQVVSDPLFWEKDPAKKNYAWANQMVQLYRSEWKSIVDEREVVAAREILNGEAKLEYVKKTFTKSADFVNNTNWTDISVMDSIRNILVAEFLKAAYTPQVEAVDVSAERQRKKDKSLLAGRATIEALLTDLNMRTGDPAYKIPEEKFEGNIQMFNELGLNDMSEEDRTFFFQTFHRLWHEIDAQELLRALMKHNEFENNVEDLINDILCANTVSFQTLALSISGEIKWNYLDPLEIRAVPGRRNDFKDSQALGFIKRITVREFLTFAGPEFDWSKDHESLAQAINMVHNTNYAFVTKQGCWSYMLDADGNRRTYLAASYSSMVRFTIDCGYIEFKSVDQIIEKKHRSTGLFYPTTEKDKSQPWPADSKFVKVVSEYEKTYKTWFIGTSSNGHKLFKFGPLYHMLSHGSADEYSSFSIHVYKNKGKTAMKIAQPFLEVVQKAFYKMLWAIDESTPQVENIHYDSIAAIIEHLTPKNPGPNGDSTSMSAGVVNQINEVLKQYKSSLIRIYTTPQNEGQKFGGNGRPHYKDDGGLDPLAVAMQTVMDWAEAQISMKLGINGPRAATTPDPKDGYKISQQALQQSRNATYYIPFMMETTIKNICNSSLMLAQDGIEHHTLVEDFLRDMIGEDAFESFRALEKIPHHRYGIFVELFNAEDRRQELKAEAQLAFQRQEITYAQYLIVKEIDDYKKAGVILTYYKNREAKEIAKQQQILHEREMEKINGKAQADMDVIDRKGEWDMRKEEIRGEYYMRGQQLPADAAIHKKQMDHDNNGQQQIERANAKIIEEEGKSRIKNQTPAPPGGTLEPEDQLQDDEQVQTAG